MKTDDRWEDVMSLGPNDNPGTISNNKPNEQEVYVFICNDDDTSVLLKSKSGTDIKKGNAKTIMNSDLETVKLLRKEESHEIKITAQSGLDYFLRFTQV